MELNFYKRRRGKRGYFFSLDALFALIIILGVVLVIRPSSTQITHDMALQEDLVGVLSTLKVGEIDSGYVRGLISSGEITNLDNTLLEQIGEFYANSNSEAADMANNLLGSLDLDLSVGLYFNNQEIARDSSIPMASAESVWTSRQIISGIGNGANGSSSGFSSRAFLFSENNANYFYFGGYVGDGNITVYLGEGVSSVKGEAVFSGNFNVSVNGNSPTEYSPSLNEPFPFTLNSGFVTGKNYLSFTSSGNLYVAGGFLKIFYIDSSPLESETKYSLPGIEGFINLYDSFFVPGSLSSLEVFLNYTSAYEVFLSIGNTLVYTGNGSNEEVTLDNSTLYTALGGYSWMDGATIPFRLGLENVSYLLNASLDADVFSVTDLSGSMQLREFCSESGLFCGSQWTCENWCGGVWLTEDKIGLAKEANKVFIDAVIDGGDENRVGLIGYSTSFISSAFHSLSRDNASLKAEVDSWVTGGSTCICCGINEGVDRLLSESDAGKFRSLVVMTDGEANVECARQGNTPDLNGNGVADDAGDDAIQAACDAYNNYGIRIYAVAFGTGADTDTTEGMASCGMGEAHTGTVENLIAIYEDIAEEIINAAYYEQTVVGEGFSTYLYPSSYISIDYEKTIPYGMIITAESEEFGADGVGEFEFPSNAIPYGARVVSYSGSKWTSMVDVNSGTGWQNVFDLEDYGIEFTELGDPYVVNLPLSMLALGNNSVNVSLGLKPNNLTLGSQYDKVIFSVVKNISSFSPIVASSGGCIWTIEFEDDTNETMSFPSDYTGVDVCSYTSSSIVYNNNHATDYAIYNLLLSLDLNSNGKIETKFTEDDLTINSIEVEGIPFVWETEAQVRVWR